MTASLVGHGGQACQDNRVAQSGANFRAGSHHPGRRCGSRLSELKHPTLRKLHVLLLWRDLSHSTVLGPSGARRRQFDIEHATQQSSRHAQQHARRPEAPLKLITPVPWAAAEEVVVCRKHIRSRAVKGADGLIFRLDVCIWRVCTRIRSLDKRCLVSSAVQQSFCAKSQFRWKARRRPRRSRVASAVAPLAPSVRRDGRRGNAAVRHLRRRNTRATLPGPRENADRHRAFPGACIQSCRRGLKYQQAPRSLSSS